MNRYIENLNYYNDPRVTAKHRKESDFTVFTDDGEEIQLPTKWKVCGLCRGEGKHVNPSIDSCGLTSEDFYEDPDFADDYYSGTYDVQCNQCHGRTTVLAVDEDACDKALLELWYEWERSEREIDATHRAEMMMGA